MTPFWTLLGKPLAALGGRSHAELRQHTAADCDKSVAVGLMCLLSLAIIGVGHWLFWQNFPPVAAVSVWVAGGVVLVFALIYRTALRMLETMSGLARALVLALLALLMGVNAMLAGHELVLLAFQPQVEAQARLSAAHDVTAYAAAVDASLGLPGLQQRGAELGQALADARTERERVPAAVQQLQQQVQACDAQAQRLQQALPTDPEHPQHTTALRQWREQRQQCARLHQDAQRELSAHRQRADQVWTQAQAADQALRQELSQARQQHQQTLGRDRDTLQASATTGFARHDALWASVAAGRVPAWAAYGLMLAVLVIDAFSFLIKLLARDDRATQERVQQADTDRVYDNLHAAEAQQLRRLVRQAVADGRQRSLDELRDALAQVVRPSVLQGVDARAFGRAAAAYRQACHGHGAPPPSMLQRLGRLARSVWQRGLPARPTAAGSTA
ncbi:DUF4407 domain-containing protein [Ideonella sp. 4Y16]|uniref:DUF4407 domain-containing protein n=1 Tax=Ideonella alba TaxID=2824118 RepID=UPI001B359253|nr:DUF4407 domain-containing protein [Ideonella alba]MBQ0942273.1 DUF4407 domain-containing protein [Ideonella alba]